MKRFHPVFAALLLILVGCTDTIDTVTREYRNTTNEAIDALMLVTDEPSALRMTNRVFKPMTARYKAIDEKLNIIKVNRVKKDLVKEVYESDGFQIYLNELDMNRQRLSLEVARLCSFLKQYEKEERMRLDEEGKFNEEPNLKMVCPGIYDLVVGGTELETLRMQLVSPKLLDLVSQFSQWKVDTHRNLHDKFMERRKTTFARPDEKRPIIID